MIDPASPSTANALLRAQGLRPRKRWGQNFLCDNNILDRIVGAALLETGDRTLEIGAGLGSLTRRLADLSLSVTSVEIDRLLKPILDQTLAGRTNIRLVYEDFLRLNLPDLLDAAFGQEPGVVVANIPYYITSPILERLLAAKNRIRRIVILVQQEVAERMAAAPGSESYGSMSVFCQFHAQVELLFRVPRTVFLPQPEVASSAVRLTPILPGAVEVADEQRYFNVVHAAFGQRRKNLLNALGGPPLSLCRAAAAEVLGRAGIDGSRRGETLSLEEFARIVRALPE